MDNGVATYRKNGALIYTSKLTVPSAQMRVFVSLYTKSSTVTQVMITSPN